jgi:hypothetical protein
MLRAQNIATASTRQPVVHERLMALSSGPLYSTVEFYHVFWQDGDFSQPETMRKENAAEKPLEVEESRR